MKIKTKNHTGMKTSLRNLVSAAAFIPCCFTFAQAEESVANNSIDLAVGGVLNGGDQAALQKRLGQDGDFYGGLRNLHMEGSKGDVNLTLDGHALIGNSDYEFIVEAVKEGLGYAQLGYSEFRTWYDGSAGYFPGATGPAGPFVQLYDDALALDRGEVWLEAGLRMEDLPEITFKYQHLWRDGKKDSTMWGRANTTGGGVARAFVPSYYDMDESRDIYSLDIAHTVDNIDLGLLLRYDDISNENTRWEKRQHSLGASGDKTITNKDRYDADLFSTHMFAKSWLNDKSLVSFGYTFTTLDTDFDGSDRVYQWVGPVSAFDHGYTDMLGGSQMKLHAANISGWWNPVEDVVFVPAIKAEWEDTSSAIDFTEMSGNTPHAALATSAIDQFSITEQMEMRYTGIDNVLLYVRGEWTQEEADRWISEEIDGAADMKLADTDRDIDKYTIGANWYPWSKVSFSAQYYYQTMQETYDPKVTDLDPLMDERSVDTQDINFRVTWKALPNVTLVTRYDYQQTEYEQNPYKTGLNDLESAETTRHIISESVTWNVNDSLYLQGNIYWISSRTKTAYDYQASGQNYVADWDNDYLSASVNAGYALSDKETIEAGISYYGADNYVNNGAASMPYGTMVDEYMLSLGYVREISPNMVWDLRYGYYLSDDDAMAGYNDFDAHLISSGLQIKF